MLSPFLSRIAKGSRPTFVEYHLADSPWSRDAFEHGCLWSREVPQAHQRVSEYAQVHCRLYQYEEQSVLAEY